MEKKLRGIVRGKTIELSEVPGVRDGQAVEVLLRLPSTASQGPHWVRFWIEFFAGSLIGYGVTEFLEQLDLPVWKIVTHILGDAANVVVIAVFGGGLHSLDFVVRFIRGYLPVLIIGAMVFTSILLIGGLAWYVTESGLATVISGVVGGLIILFAASILIVGILFVMAAVWRWRWSKDGDWWEKMAESINPL